MTYTYKNGTRRFSVCRFILSFFLCPKVVCARAVVFLCSSSQLDKASAFAADAVFESVTFAADIEPALVFFGACSDVIGDDLDQLADLFIQPLGVDFQKQTALTDGFTLYQHSSIERTEHAGSLTVSFSPSSVTPS